MITGNIVYAATPFRMEQLTEDICDFIEREGRFPLHPFNALPYKRFNYDRHTKENIYRVCFGMVDIAGEVWIFGIGSGSFKEFARAEEQGKPTRSLVKIFDPQWEEYSRREKYTTGWRGEITWRILEISETPKP